MSTRRSLYQSPIYAPPSASEASARVIAWSAGGSAHERFIGRMLGHVAHITFCHTESALADEIAKGGDTVVLVELVDEGGPPVSSIVQGVKRHFPSVPVLGYCWLGPAVSAEIVACARAGLDALALRGYDDLTMMVRRALARERGDDAIVLLELESMLPGALLPWARAVLERAREGPDVGAIARAIGCGPRTMERTAQALGAASPARLISCVRLLYAARLLAFRRLGVDEAAALAGYPSGVALRRAFRREHLVAPVEPCTTARYALVREFVRQSVRLARAVRPALTAVTTPIMALSS